MDQENQYDMLKTRIEFMIGKYIDISHSHITRICMTDEIKGELRIYINAIHLLTNILKDVQDEQNETTI
jgi:hypothetical protein